jgi:hypothetical protein
MHVPRKRFIAVSEIWSSAFAITKIAPSEDGRCLRLIRQPRYPVLIHGGTPHQFYIISSRINFFPSLMPQTRLYLFRLSPFAFLVGGRRDERVKIWEEARGHILLGKDQGHAMLREESALRFERCIFRGGVLFGFPENRLRPPEHSRVELTTFARQNRIVGKLWLATGMESRNATE